MDETRQPRTLEPAPPALAAAFRQAAAAAQAGRLEEAAAGYRALLRARPNWPQVHANLGFVLLGLRRFAEAASHLGSVLEARPDEVPARVGLAWASQKQADWSGAEAHYRRALKMQPNHVQAMLGLGTSLRSLGCVDEACRWFEQAARVDPGCVDAYHLLSILRGFREGEPLFAQCEALQPRVAALAPIKRARYWFALGKMREDVGRFDDAFDAYARGNRARASLFVLDESDAEAWLARTCAAFDAKRLAAYPPDTTACNRVPVFVVGMPRSGTSLIEQILASHARVGGAGEIADLSDVVSARAGAPDAWPDTVPRLADATLRELGNAYLERVFRAAPGVTHVINKTTLNYRHVGLIRMLLPQARIIHAVRDPMDSCFSCYTHLFDGDNLPYSYDLQTLGRYYVRYAKLMRHWHAVAPDALLDVHYEGLVRDTAGTVRRMLDYLGLPWDASCLDFHRNPRIVETASRVQVRQPVYQNSVARWRRFQRHLGPLLALVGDWR